MGIMPIGLTFLRVLNLFISIIRTVFPPLRVLSDMAAKGLKLRKVKKVFHYK